MHLSGISEDENPAADSSEQGIGTEWGWAKDRTGMVTGQGQGQDGEGAGNRLDLPSPVSGFQSDHV